MSAIAIKFMAAAIVILSSTVAGYLCRRFQWLNERASEGIMTFVAVFGYSSVAFLSVWNTRLQGSDAIIPLLAILHTLTMTGLGVVFARSLTGDRKERGVFAMASGVGNNGFTGGAFVLYLLHGEQAMGLANIYVLPFMGIAVLLLYPLARFYAEEKPVGKLSALLIKSLLDKRSVGLPIVIFAIMLSAGGVQRPAWIQDLHIIDILVFTITPLAFFGIGLRLRFSKVLPLTKLIAGLALMRFVVGALVAIGLAWLLQFTPWPFEKLRWDVYVVQGFVPTAITMVAVANMFNLRPTEASVLFMANTVMYLVFVLPLVFWFFT